MEEEHRQIQVRVTEEFSLFITRWNYVVSSVECSVLVKKAVVESWSDPFVQPFVFLAFFCVNLHARGPSLAPNPTAYRIQCRLLGVAMSIGPCTNLPNRPLSTCIGFLR